MTKQINLSQSPARRSRSSLGDWLIAASALLTFLMMLAVIIGGLFWIALKIWGAALSII